MYDLIIKNGNIADGNGSDLFKSDIAIKDGKIAKIEKSLDGAQQIIDAEGLVVSPGFIDSHSHSDSALFSLCHDQKEKLEQGITLSMEGCCGWSSIGPKIRHDPEKLYFKTMGEAFSKIGKIPLGANLATCVGHGAVRAVTIGYDQTTPEGTEKMSKYVKEAMESGAFGMSLGLFYAPGSFSATEEVVALAKVVKEYDGIVSSHLRDEGDKLVEAVEEFIEIIKKSGARGVVSHHKAAWKQNHGKVLETIRLIEEANLDGCDIYMDVYPYTASNTTLSARFIPKEYYPLGIKNVLSDEKHREEIKAKNIERFGEDLSFALVTKCDAYPEYLGKTIAEISKLHKKGHYETLFDLILKCNVPPAACFFSMSEDDVKIVLKHPRTMIGSDSGVSLGEPPLHPRLRGTFPRVLGRYVREQGLTTLPEMIRKMTSLPAHVYGFKNKGQIKEGFDADICIFNPETIIDHADYVDCTKPNEGLSYVLVGGKIAVKDNAQTGELNGRLVLKESK